ncbi:MAG: sugar transferase, partial [Candidatus Pacebacteria bacterium]|nr:sugar transferase [Candidatus Paceibacterota bacterium]
MLKRIFDVLFSMLIVCLLSPLLLLLALIVKLTSKGPVLYWSERVGKNNQLFRMPKFRSMRIDTPQVATHLLSDPSVYLSPVG